MNVALVAVVVGLFFFGEDSGWTVASAPIVIPTDPTAVVDWG